MIKQRQERIYKKKKKKMMNVQELKDNYKRCNIYIMRMSGVRKKRKTEEIFDIIMSESLPKLMTRHQPQIQKAQRGASKASAIKNLHLGVSYSNDRKIRVKEEIVKAARSH